MKTSVPLQIKASDIGGDGIFSGHAAAYTRDLSGDTILPGAFAATLAEHKARGSAPALLWAHDQSLPIGTLTDIREDEKGLFTRGKLTLETKAASEAYALLRAGAVGGMSIGYSVPQGGWEHRGDSRLLKEINLHEISLVAVPMNPDARVTSVKAMHGVENVRELEHVLRETFALSGRKSKRAANLLWPLLNGCDGREGDREDREAESKKLEEIISQLRSVNAILTKGR